jgi:hypothetical protein
MEGAEVGDTARAVSQMFAGDKLLGSTMAGVFQAATQNTTFLTLMATQSGVTGWATPESIIPTMQEAGVDIPQAFMKAIQYVAQASGGSGSQANRVGIFQRMLNQNYGVPVDTAQAKALYLKVTGEQGQGGVNEAKKAEGAAAQAQGDTSSSAGESRTPGMGTAINKAQEGDWGGFIMDLVKGAVNAVSPGQPFGGPDAGQGNEPAEGTYGSGSGPFEQTAGGPRPRGSSAQSNNGTTTTKGEVGGELRITVDQQGNVKAPPSVRLSGNQIAVNSGFGGGTLNNPSPGDQTYGHNNSGMG